MAINTIGGVDITTALRARIADEDGADYEFSDAVLNSWLVHSVGKYSEEQPYIQETTISHVADQDIYALPTGFMRMLECQYRLSLDTNIYEPIADATIAAYSTYDLPGLDMIRRFLRARYDSIGRGWYEVISCRVSYAVGLYLIVYPAPTASTGTFTIRYAITHPLHGTNYTTIPAGHAHYFIDLLESASLRRRAVKFSKTPMDYDAGQTRIRRGGVVEFLFREAGTIEAQVWNALRGSPIGIG